MERTEVSSSNIESIGYDESKKVLEIEFKKGNIYQYQGVPDNIFQNLLHASSHGKYFNAHIKDRYPTIKIS
ncbi:KTSC domain-containing protein [Methanosarcina sp. DH1]|uniref:KTSC domain-containing protein n=1 Tax=Methanosarcina sp. DH1 TaxID=2605695 RepID=UPI001E3948F3|nr:KTSC domain-containing protein [Methanosarcina sp. DH1]MCC4766197.1 KTSC domain-containing protein [Methanosarcina sp. DH1]